MIINESFIARYLPMLSLWQVSRSITTDRIDNNHLILSCYFTTLPDPQSGNVIEPDDLGRILPWVKSISKLGLFGIIIHDNLSERFCNRISVATHGHVKFERRPPSNGMSQNDYRFFLYKEFLSNNAFQTVFCTDLFDVRINRNPCEIVSSEYALWVQKETDRRIEESTPEGNWMLKRFSEAYDEIPEEVYGKPILNAGVWGGTHEEVLRFLGFLVDEIDRIDPVSRFINCNMAAFNRVLYGNFYAGRIWIKGAPLHSEFKQYQTNAPVCFVHK